MDDFSVYLLILGWSCLVDGRPSFCSFGASPVCEKVNIYGVLKRETTRVKCLPFKVLVHLSHSLTPHEKLPYASPHPTFLSFFPPFFFFPLRMFLILSGLEI